MKLLIILLAIFLSGCTNEGQIFKECQFELTKIIAMRGQPLDSNDELNRVMKRQFFRECFEAKGYKLSNEMLIQRIN